MLRTSERETEILLGNKQLLGIFFVLAILLGVAFYGGYVVGKGAAARKPTPAAAAATEAPAASLSVPATGGETHSVPADSGTASDSTARISTDTAAPTEPPPLGSPKRKSAAKAQPEPSPDLTTPAADTSAASATFVPKGTFLQVTAVGHDDAVAIANVLLKKGFPAHAVPKPGNSKLYRVIVGPVHDAGDLASTRDSLRKTGFREVIVQHY
jgi:cell division septation protein DedD